MAIDLTLLDASELPAALGLQPVRPVTIIVRQGTGGGITRLRVKRTGCACQRQPSTIHLIGRSRIRIIAASATCAHRVAQRRASKGVRSGRHNGPARFTWPSHLTLMRVTTWAGPAR